MFYGTRTFGQVDTTVGGSMYVFTLFDHILWVPIIYRGSYLACEGRGLLKIPISWKSIFFAYLRAVLLWSLIPAAWMSIVLLFAGEQWKFTGVLLAITVVLMVTLYLSFLWSGPNQLRVLELSLLAENRADDFSIMF